MQKPPSAGYARQNIPEGGHAPKGTLLTQRTQTFLT